MSFIADYEYWLKHKRNLLRVQEAIQLKHIENCKGDAFLMYGPMRRLEETRADIKAIDFFLLNIPKE